MNSYLINSFNRIYHYKPYLETTHNYLILSFIYYSISIQLKPKVKCEILSFIYHSISIQLKLKVKCEISIKIIPLLYHFDSFYKPSSSFLCSSSFPYSTQIIFTVTFTVIGTVACAGTCQCQLP